MGRSDDMLIIKGVNVYPSQVEEVLIKQGMPAKVKLVEPKSITRSEGKAVRVIDKRKI